MPYGFVQNAATENHNPKLDSRGGNSAPAARLRPITLPDETEGPLRGYRILSVGTGLALRLATRPSYKRASTPQAGAQHHAPFAKSVETAFPEKSR